MPGHRCVVFGCKSSYSRKEKRNFFTVPKDDDRLKLWAQAIARKDLVIKPGQVVCDLHFNREEIIRSKIFTDSYGNIVAEASYKIPKLKIKAIPSIFPNRQMDVVPNQLMQRSPIVNTQNKRKRINTEENDNITPAVQNSVESFSFSSIQNNYDIIIVPKG